MAAIKAPGFSFRDDAPVVDAAAAPREHRFYPYESNGGSTLGIAGADFVVLAGDTRMTSGFHINTRHHPKLFKIGGTTTDQSDATLVLSVCNFMADAEALKERLDTICKMYRYRHGKPMSVAAAARRLSNLLYGRRFFPYDVSAMIAGLDEDGKGALYKYDQVGSCERSSRSASGAAASLMMPFLDNQVNFENQYEPDSGDGLTLQERQARPLSRDEVAALVKDAFDGAVERHIEVGDSLQILAVTASGIEENFAPLKKD